MREASSFVSAHPDALSMVQRDDAAALALACLDPLDGKPMAELVVATALMLAALCTKLGLDEKDQLHRAYRILNPEPFDRRANMRLDALLDWIGIDKARDRQREEWGLL